MASRKINPEVEEIFSRYTPNSMVRRLNHDNAIRLFTKEFHISKERAEEFFNRFDADGNGQLSLWEFQHFYNVVGDKAAEIVFLFESLDIDGNGTLSLEEAKGMDTMKTAEGVELKAKDVELNFRRICGDKIEMELNDFLDLLIRLKFYGNPLKPNVNR